MWSQHVIPGGHPHSGTKNLCFAKGVERNWCSSGLFFLTLLVVMSTTDAVTEIKERTEDTSEENSNGVRRGADENVTVSTLRGGS